MATAALAGLGLGALHAVVGPDHLLALAPQAVARRGGAWRAGLSWGLGHAVGTVAWFLLAASFFAGSRDWVASHAERAAGAALLAMGAVTLWRSRKTLWQGRKLRQAAPPSVPRHGSERGSFAIGTVHGLTGAAALLILLPALGADGAQQLGWLGGFAFGSTVAMAALTTALATVGRRVPAVALRRAPGFAGAASVVVGALWMLA